MPEVDMILANMQFAWFYLLTLLLQIGPVQLFFDVFRALVPYLYPVIPQGSDPL